MDIIVTDHANQRAYARGYILKEEVVALAEQSFKMWVVGIPGYIHWLDEPTFSGAKFWIPMRMFGRSYFIAGEWQIWDVLIVKTIVPVETLPKRIVWRNLLKLQMDSKPLDKSVIKWYNRYTEIQGHI